MKKIGRDPSQSSETRRLRSTAVMAVLALEVIFGLLLLYSMRYLFQPSWAAKKLDELQQQQALAQAAPPATATAVATLVPASPTPSEPPTETPLPATATATDLPPTATPAATRDLNPLSAEASFAMGTIFQPLPAAPLAAANHPLTPELVDLGRMLYYETRISADEKFSCNTCHDLQTYGVDNKDRSLGVTGEPVARNSPTVYQAALHVAQFWDGRSPDVEDQATKPIMAAGEMGMLDANRVKTKLESIEGYQARFKAAFPDDADPIHLTNVGIAIGAFERGLLTPSRFDKFLAGDTSQLSGQEIQGFNTFVALRCVTCHTGATVGGMLYKKLGAIEAYTTEDQGRYAVTKASDDLYVFKVPSLRNVAKTAPYLHDGSIPTLEEMVRLMARYQLGKSIGDEQVSDVIAFLNSLTGEIPEAYIAKPKLP